MTTATEMSIYIYSFLHPDTTKWLQVVKTGETSGVGIARWGVGPREELIARAQHVLRLPHDATSTTLTNKIGARNVLAYLGEPTP